jgi:3-hydroxyisobutyrate dehydrogenase-like beta-hydroxyacid dehydrogenase
MKLMKIGIIGLGAMGKQIALKLLAAGHELVVWDRDPSAVEFAVAAGAVPAKTVSDALQGELALSVLWDDQAIRSVLFNSAGLDGAAPGLVHMCMSTITFEFAQELVDYHAARNIAFIGAPMLGRPEVIPGGGLNILAAAAPALLDRVEKPLSCLGRLWRMGTQPVEGYCAKLAANFMISGAIESMAEAVAVLGGFGANTDMFISAMTETLFSCFIYKSYGAMVTGRVPPPPTPLGLAMPIKDNANFIGAAAKAGAHTPLAHVIKANLATAVAQGYEKEDWSTALAKVARGKN